MIVHMRLPRVSITQPSHIRRKIGDASLKHYEAVLCALYKNSGEKKCRTGCARRMWVSGE